MCSRPARTGPISPTPIWPKSGGFSRIRSPGPERTEQTSKPLGNSKAAGGHRDSQTNGGHGGRLTALKGQAPRWIRAQIKVSGRKQQRNRETVDIKLVCRQERAGQALSARLFFFEKKNQKTFGTLAGSIGKDRAQHPKVFCFFFSKKKAFLG
jgi:hypothetical protein